MLMLWMGMWIKMWMRTETYVDGDGDLVLKMLMLKWMRMRIKRIIKMGMLMLWMGMEMGMWKRT